MHTSYRTCTVSANLPWLVHEKYIVCLFYILTLWLRFVFFLRELHLTIVLAQDFRAWSCTGISPENVAAVLPGSWKVPCLAYRSWNNCECAAGCHTQRKGTRGCQNGSAAHETVAGKTITSVYRHVQHPKWWGFFPVCSYSTKLKLFWKGELVLLLSFKCCFGNCCGDLTWVTSWFCLTSFNI